MSQQIDLRKGARRQHRGAAMFCALKCLHYDWDAIQVSRDELQWMLGLERFKQKRVSWLEEDFAEFFPFQYQHSEYGIGATEVYAGQTLGFRPITSNDSEPFRVGKLNFQTDPWYVRDDIKKTCLAPLGLKHINGSELAITSLLTMLAHGQIGMSDLFGREESSVGNCPHLRDVRDEYKSHKLSRRPFS
jgi:hypothetical protein